SVKLRISGKSTFDIESILNKDVVVLDDMVRTGSTIVSCCKILQDYNPRKIVILLTHFFSTYEVKQNLGQPCIDEIITTSTMPDILNRDNQGRLRRKMAVLKITKWLASYLDERLKLGIKIKGSLYDEDMSNKNPRSKNWQGEN
ncbi:MAG: ribose-phosphate pyrophosphokinase, partial [Bacteroidales bacterium]|nr:ribose-phosphate pyrophosphokinase [Bacteroidales bacterium]